ncbi:MAG: hypothetical protein PVSMB1_18240 [Gemmatimonadaceae bacterium]
MFPDRLPIGVRSDGGIAFLYLVTTSMADDLRAFLQRHSDVLRALPGWSVLLLFPRHVARMMASYQAAARDELTTRFSTNTANG